MLQHCHTSASLLSVMMVFKPTKMSRHFSPADFFKWRKYAYYTVRVVEPMNSKKNKCFKFLTDCIHRWSGKYHWWTKCCHLFFGKLSKSFVILFGIHRNLYLISDGLYLVSHDLYLISHDLCLISYVSII